MLRLPPSSSRWESIHGLAYRVAEGVAPRSAGFKYPDVTACLRARQQIQVTPFPRLVRRPWYGPGTGVADPRTGQAKAETDRRNTLHGG